jgi:uncharacterized membrane protein SpoIIM required for sporulation
MAELQLKSRRFREEREHDWRRLERLLNRIETNGARTLSDDDLLAAPVLYRAALSSLSTARSISLDQALLAYLEALCSRAYFVIYGIRTSPWSRVARFFAEDWPKAVQSLWRETLIAFAILGLGAVIAYLMVNADPDWFYSFMPRSMAGGRDPTATTAALRATLYDQGTHVQALSVFATFLFTHNAEVALFGFALGFAFGIPTAYLTLLNGCALGALFAVFAQRGLGLDLGGWLMIHGVTELFATTLSGAAGFHVGWAVAFPGRKRRVDALIDAGRQTGAVMLGVALMLFVAGALEGVARQLVTDLAARYVIAALSGGLWLAYFYLPRARRAT